MPCDNFNNLSGCGYCYVLINDEYNMSKLSNSSFNILLNNMLLLFHRNSDKKLLPNSTKIRCDGTIVPVYDTNNPSYHSNHNRQICTSILQIWYRSHNEEIDNSITVMYLVTALSTLLNDKSENQCLRNIDNFTNVRNVINSINDEEQF